MPIFRGHGFVEDEWVVAGDDTAMPAGKAVVSKGRFVAEREALTARNAPLGLILRSGENLDGLENDIERFGLIVLDIPKYTDGRSYSTARLLRERYKYSGELRASGDVLRDQIMFLHRVGFDAFDVTHEGTVAALRDGKMRLVRKHYQPAAREDEEAAPGLRPWLRVSPRGVPGDSHDIGIDGGGI
ncbi:MAG: hypothetical protein QOH65_731 [Methylobacteriaceae bacterium]|jgi:uncharacterized protein (DUF934 family)|nr:hypothetical protein [Methylobacteriaceae bacterium]